MDMAYTTASGDPTHSHRKQLFCGYVGNRPTEQSKHRITARPMCFTDISLPHNGSVSQRYLNIC